MSGTALRGEDRRNRITRWSRWFPPTPTVDASQFQSGGEPYPRHWRRVPRSRSGRPFDCLTVRAELRDAIADLPDAWRDVIQQRDVRGWSAADVSRELRITDAQQRRMLNRARALLRHRLADRLTMDDQR
jgi:DNA-directed RNA polymerase specialized sigma24 family protein